MPAGPTSSGQRADRRRHDGGPARERVDGGETGSLGQHREDRGARAPYEGREPGVGEVRRVGQRIADVLTRRRPGERRTVVRTRADEQDARRPRILLGE